MADLKKILYQAFYLSDLNDKQKNKFNIPENKELDKLNIFDKIKNIEETDDEFEKFLKVCAFRYGSEFLDWIITGNGNFEFIESKLKNMLADSFVKLETNYSPDIDRKIKLQLEIYKTISSKEVKDANEELSGEVDKIYKKLQEEYNKDNPK